MNDRIEGKVAAILDKHTVVINRGSTHGVKRGDTFYIYNVLGPFKDPDTGESLGTAENTLSRVTVDTLEDKFCIASTPKFVSNAFNIMMSRSLVGNTSRKTLPLAGEGKAEKSNPRVVRVGSPVFLVPEKSEDQSESTAPGTEPDSGTDSSETS